MSEMTPQVIRHLAELSRIALGDEEIQRLSGELGAIVSAVEAVSQVATDDVPPTSHPLPLGNVFRDDIVGETLSTEEALAGAPDHDGSRFRVSAILGEEQ
jgi:aspartyl-tRNA(Asn)/glutamyl-tRNA(Gln) amidotransferase subunit C